jgi:hypothetical protein
MRKTVATLIVVPLVLAWCGSARAEKDDPGRAVVERAIKAAGGEAALTKYKAHTFKETGKYYGMGEGLPYNGRYAVQWPDKFRMEIEGVFTIVINGDQGWRTMGGETTELSKDELAVTLHNNRANWITTLLPLRDKAFTLTSLGEAKVDRTPAVAIKVTRKDYPEVKLFFDMATNLLIKSEFQTKSGEEGFKEVTQEIYYSDHKDVDGVKVPTKLVFKRNGKPYIETEVKDHKAVDKLDDKLFAKP